MNPEVLLMRTTAELHIHNVIMLIVIANLVWDCHRALLITIQNDTARIVFKVQMKQEL